MHIIPQACSMRRRYNTRSNITQLHNFEKEGHVTLAIQHEKRNEFKSEHEMTDPMSF